MIASENEAWKDEKRFSRNDIDQMLEALLLAHGVKLGVHVNDILAGRADPPPPAEIPEALNGIRSLWGLSAERNGRRAEDVSQDELPMPIHPEPPYQEPEASRATAEPLAPEPSYEPPVKPAQQCDPEELIPADELLAEHVDAADIPAHKYEAYEMRMGGMKVAEIAEHFGKHRGTVYRWLTHVASAEGSCIRDRHPFHLTVDLLLGVANLEDDARRDAKRAKSHAHRALHRAEARRLHKQRADLMWKTGMLRFTPRKGWDQDFKDHRWCAKRLRKGLREFSNTGEIPERTAVSCEG